MKKNKAQMEVEGELRKDKVLAEIKKSGVSQVEMCFTDVLGFLKTFTVPLEELEVSLREGQGFDGSSIHGYVRIDESDMVAMPDLDTLRIWPWPVGGQRIGVMFCDILRPGGEPYGGDPRYVLKKMVEKAKAAGFDHVYTGPEAEYFYFKDSWKPEPLDLGGYFDVIDKGKGIRTETVHALQRMGIEVEYHHHEVAPSQHEIDLRFKDAVLMADQLMLYRQVVKTIAEQHGVYASFMPKPLFGENGSGMHVHQSLFQGEKNAFFDVKDKHHLSQAAYQYIAGILKYLPEVTLVLNQWVNSYKRLVPGYEAPVYLTWAVRNRSDLVRVPDYKPGHEKATRIEVRSPDPACNPYLAFAAMLGCGLMGIQEELPVPEATRENAFEMSDEKRKKRGIGTLPGTLEEAIHVAQESALLRAVLGGHVFGKLIENKKREWDNYRVQVHPYEIGTHLPLL